MIKLTFLGSVFAECLTITEYCYESSNSIFCIYPPLKTSENFGPEDPRSEDPDTDSAKKHGFTFHLI